MEDRIDVVEIDTVPCDTGLLVEVTDEVKTIAVDSDEVPSPVGTLPPELRNGGERLSIMNEVEIVC